MRPTDIHGCSQIHFSPRMAPHMGATSFLHVHYEEETQCSFVGNVLLFFSLDTYLIRTGRAGRSGGEEHATSGGGGGDDKSIFKSTPGKIQERRKHRQPSRIPSARQSAALELQKSLKQGSQSQKGASEGLSASRHSGSAENP